jgi:hypothetical protein
MRARALLLRASKEKAAADFSAGSATKPPAAELQPFREARGIDPAAVETTEVTVEVDAQAATDTSTAAE